MVERRPSHEKRTPLIKEHISFNPEGFADLNSRELAVLERLNKGRNSFEIASELAISVESANIFTSSLLRKTGIKKRNDLTEISLGLARKHWKKELKEQSETDPTAQEGGVINLRAQGYSDINIGRSLMISEETVDKDLASLSKKLGKRNPGREKTVDVIKWGLIDKFILPEDVVASCNSAAFKHLNDQEDLLVRMLCKGLDEKQIAEELLYSETGTKTALSRLNKKVGTKNEVHTAAAAASLMKINKDRVKIVK